MNTTKYNYRRIGNHLFRIRLDRYDDTCFGIRIRYEIQEPADIPRNWWERLKQFFTVGCYHFGYWCPSLSEITLEERLTRAMNEIIQEWETQNAAEKEWEAL